MAKALPVWTALLLVIATGVVTGLWTNRWAASAEIQTAVGRLEDFPLMVGDWEGHAQALDERQLGLGEIAGYATCRYVNPRNGNAITVLLVCGLPGPISVHTPEVCYRGAGYVQTAPLVKHPLEWGSSPPAEFRVGNFSKQDPAAAEHLRIFWAWSAAGPWQAPDNPRVRFARYPALYKLYVIRPMLTANEPLENDPALDFLRLLLPRLQQSLFPVS